jgi:hypothetical protein
MLSSLDYQVSLYLLLPPIPLLHLVFDSPLLLALLILRHDLLLVPFAVVAVVLVPPLYTRVGVPLFAPPPIAYLVLPRLVVLPLVVPLRVLPAIVVLPFPIFQECHRPFGLFFRLAWLSSPLLTMWSPMLHPFLLRILFSFFFFIFDRSS